MFTTRTEELKSVAIDENSDDDFILGIQDNKYVLVPKENETLFRRRDKHERNLENTPGTQDGPRCNSL